MSFSAAADYLNHDDDLDVYVANLGVNRVYIGDGSGGVTVSDTGLSPVGNSRNSWAVALGDLNGDGNLEAFITNNGSEDLIYLGDGTGGFDGGSNASAATGQSMSAVVGEFDGR
ncbi:MAG: FG-GAP repeat domain-containing protein [Spirochaetaceae bacterium]